MNTANPLFSDPTVLGKTLRSENRALRQEAAEYVLSKTEGLYTERERAKAVGVSGKTWSFWLRDGLVKRLPKNTPKRSRTRSPTAPTNLELGRQWITVRWVLGKHGSNGRSLRKAEVTTSTGKTFTLPSWEGVKFVDAMASLGWQKTNENS